MSHSRPHPSPPLWILATVSAALYVGGVIVLGLAGGGPDPSATDAAVADQLGRGTVRTALAVSAFATFGASVPLGLYAASVHSRLQYLGIRAAGAAIALYGGVGASLLLGLAGLASWVLARPAVLASLPVARAVQDLGYITGGSGHVVLLGLLLAGVAVPALIVGLLPRWLAVAGLAVAAICELASLTLLWSALTPLVPVGRFASLAWLIAAGALLPRSRGHAVRAGVPHDDGHE